jgi:dCTP deaminase
MIISDRDIEKKVKNKEIVVEPFKIENLQPSSLDLELSDEVRVFDNWNESEIDVRKKEDLSRKVKIKNGGFVLHPGEFILGSTIEKVTLPLDVAAKLEGRSSLGRLGLIIHATAGYVDPGFSGWLTFEIANISRLPIRIYPGIRIAQIVFFQLTSKVKNAYGCRKLKSKYQGQKGPTASRHWQDFDDK